jgi:hypothetical protein
MAPLAGVSTSGNSVVSVKSDYRYVWSAALPHGVAAAGRLNLPVDCSKRLIGWRPVKISFRTMWDEKFTANRSSSAPKVTFRPSPKPRPAMFRNSLGKRGERPLVQQAKAAHHRKTKLLKREEKEIDPY